MLKECTIHANKVFVDFITHSYTILLRVNCSYHWQRKLLKVRMAALLEFLLENLHSYGKALNLSRVMAPCPLFLPSMVHITLVIYRKKSLAIMHVVGITLTGLRQY